jgi:hypothetical protein
MLTRDDDGKEYDEKIADHLERWHDRRDFPNPQQYTGENAEAGELIHDQWPHEEETHTHP